MTTRVRHRLSRWYALVALLAAGGEAAAVDFATDVHPFFERYCYQCHNAEDAASDLDMQTMDAAAYRGDAALLDNLLWMVREEEMPPRDAEAQPHPEEREVVARWLETALAELQNASPNDPGVVVMARLTNREYDNVVRDLTGVDLGLARYFAADPVAGAGFENVGAALTMTPPQIEQYLLAAKKLLGHARITPERGIVWNQDGYPATATLDDARASALERYVGWYDTEANVWGLLTGTYGNDNPVYNATGLYRFAYLDACWRYRHREALGMPEAGLREIAASYDHPLSPSTLTNWWELLTTDIDEPPLSIRHLRDFFHALPGPDAMDREARLARIRDYADWWTMDADGAPGEPRLRGERGDRFRTALADGHWLAEIAIERDSWKNPYHQRHDIDRIHVVVTDCGDGAAGDRVLWEELAFATPSGPVPWSACDPRDAAGAPVRPAPDGTLAIQAPGSVTLAIPADATAISGSARIATDSDSASAQVLILPGPPLDPHLAPNRPAIGRGDALAAFAAAQDRADEVVKLHGHRIEHPHIDSPEHLIGVLDDLPTAPFGIAAPQTLRRTPWQPFYLLPGELEADATAERRQRLAELATEVREVAEPELHVMAAFLRERGLADAHGLTVPDPATVASWSSDHAERYRQLRHAVEAIEDQRLARAEELVVDLATRAWRQTLDDELQAWLMEPYDALRPQGASFDAAVKASLLRVFTSPRFFFRLQPSAGSTEAYALDGDEIAERLAFTLWGTLPDAELLRAAAAGELDTEAGIAVQVERMLGDERIRHLAEAFAGVWLGFADFDEFGGPDAERFSAYTESLRAAMHEEAIRFVIRMLRENRPLTDLIEADATFLNEELAAHYGIDGVTGENLRLVDLGDSPRGGLLTMGAVLTRTSEPLRTSPVKRGTWLLEDVLGHHLPPPPPAVPMLSDEEVDDKGRTIREQLEQHRADPACAGCHARIDPLGIALEHFDPIGRWRDTDGAGNPIDDTDRDQDGTVIAGLDGLRRYLRSHTDEIARQFTRQLLGYSLGRDVAITDRPLVDAILADLEADDYRVMHAITGVLTSHQFRHRRDHEAR